MTVIGSALKIIDRQDDVEYEQSVIRLILGTAVIIFMLLGAPTGEWMTYVFTCFFIITTVILVHTHLYKGDFPARIIAGQLCDMTALTVILSFGGPEAAISYCIYLWVIVGNGFRYGFYYLITITVIACISFGYVILTVPFWQQQGHLSFGLWLTLLVVPAYLFGLLKRLEIATNRLNKLSLRDGLTGLYNRRALDEQMEHEFERLSREPSPFGLLLLDIDHFKLINDSHGHLAGDQVLQQIAHVITESCRRVDFVSRYGGEEFALLAPGLCDTDIKPPLAERIRRAVEDASINIGDRSIHVTVSIGVAYWDKSFEDYGRWLNAADRAMYKAKTGGRNNVVYHQVETTIDIENLLV
jgi:diguanylate cyclase (GGDEF)-like protein